MGFIWLFIYIKVSKFVSEGGAYDNLLLEFIYKIVCVGLIAINVYLIITVKTNVVFRVLSILLSVLFPFWWDIVLPFFFIANTYNAIKGLFNLD